MKVSYKFFKEYPATRILIGKLMEASYPSVKSSYGIKKMIDVLGKEFEIYIDLLKDKEGIIKWNEDKKIVNPDEVKEVFDELHAHEFDVEFGPLTSDELKALRHVSPKELELLQMISDPTAFDSLLT